MAHLVETMAYAGEVPWHGLGERVSNDLSPLQMMQKAGVDWTVEKVPAYVKVGNQEIATGQQALIRNSDNSVLTNVGENWEPVQNEEAFNFFNEFCAAGDMEMHTAGSLKDGQIVWVLAKIKESFDILGKDQVDSYLLLSNPHVYGQALNVRFTPIRVVCNNTLTFSLSQKSKNEVRLNHRAKFDPDFVKEQLGIAHEKFELYRDMATFLANKRAKPEDMIQYFNNVFPIANGVKKDVRQYADLSRNAKMAYDVLETQPGADLAMGTWWNALNAVTYVTDHKLGRTADSRLTSAWYGYNRGRKVQAVNDAVAFAEAA